MRGFFKRLSTRRLLNDARSFVQRRRRCGEFVTKCFEPREHVRPVGFRPFNMDLGGSNLLQQVPLGPERGEVLFGFDADLTGGRHPLSVADVTTTIGIAGKCDREEWEIREIDLEAAHSKLGLAIATPTLGGDKVERKRDH